MSPQSTKRISLCAVAALQCAWFAAGCASWQLPRIDPSGERLLLWPNQAAAAPTFAPPPGAPSVSPVSPVIVPGAPAGMPPATVAPPFGNMQAPPVYPDPAAPVGPVPAVIPGAVTPPPVITVPGAPPVSTTSVTAPWTAALPVGQAHLRVTPDRVMAPVGSEVILKAGICGADGYLITNQRVEWLLPPGGQGQFVDLAERDHVTVLRWPWDTPQKIDNTYAITSTLCAPVCLDRGTPFPNDDVQIVPGDAWISVTSASEGVSHVTAFTPAVSDWNFRRATATIYWIDAQWVLPASAVVEAGRPHVLTTTVMRRTDGAPLAGWLVRYEVASGGSLGYEGGNVVEVPTDAAGRASIEVSPNDVGGGTTNVGITIVRPPQGGADAIPRLEVGRGAATVSWSSVAIGAPSAPPPVSPGPATPMPPPSSASPPLEPTPQPELLSTPSTSDPYTPPRGEPAQGRPLLELQLQRTTQEQVAVGDYASSNLTVTNRGDGTARGIRVHVRFDEGLAHLSARPGVYEIDYQGMRALPPGESETIPLTFQVTAGGTQCHEVTVSAEGAQSQSARGCVTAPQAELQVTANASRRSTVGEIAEFGAVVRNVGTVAATNVLLVARYDAELEPVEAEPGHKRLPDGAVTLEIDRLEPGERRTFGMTARCQAQSNNACTRFIVTADGGVTAATEACVEILPLRPPSGPGAAGAPAAGPDLRLTVTESKNPARAGERQVVVVNARNEGLEPAQQVQLRVLFPPEMTPDASQIQPAGEATVLNMDVTFSPIAELAPQAERRYLIPVAVNRTGQVQIRAQLTAAGLASPITVESNVIEILPAQ